MASISEEVAALRGTRPATFKDLLTQPAFSRLVAAMAVSSFGDWVGFVAVAALVAARGGSLAASSFAVAGVMIARTVPAIIFGPIAGTVVDRFDRKRLMIASDIGRGALYFSMPFVGPLWGVLALSFVIECLSLVWGPARDASLPNLVPRRQLANANSVVLMTTYATLPLGAFVFALLAGFSRSLGARVPYFGENTWALALWLDAGSFIFSAVMVSQLSLKSPAAHRDESLDMSRVWRDIKEGILFLREHHLAGVMTTGIAAGFVGMGAVLSLGPVFVARTLDAGPEGWGVLVTTYGVGMAIGLATVGLVCRVLDREHVFYLSMISASVTLFFLAAMPNLALVATCAAFLGIFVGMVWVTGYTMLQESVADEFRGRTFASLAVLSRLALFVSLIVFPLIGAAGGDRGFDILGQHLDMSGPRLALWVAGGIVLAGGLYTRQGMNRYRLTKAMPLNLIPKLRKASSKGVFIVFEGVEGAGKGTQMGRAKDFIESKGREVLMTREPGGTKLGESLRKILLSHETGSLEPKTEALLFGAARAQLVASVIRPALEDGKVVLCDRYIDSSVAYQGFARGLGERDILSLNVWATQGLFPDLVLLLHVEPEQGLARAGEADRIESEGVDFHAKVADAFLHIASEHPERVAVIDAAQPVEKVFTDVKQAIDRAIPEWEKPSR